MVINTGVIAAVIAATNNFHKQRQEKEKQEQKKRQADNSFKQVIQDTYIKSEESNR